MNFEHLSKNESLATNFTKKNKKIKKFFEFQISNVTFLNILLYQNLEVKIINVPLQDNKTTKKYDSESSNFTFLILNIIFVFLIFTFIYMYIYNIFIIWYNDNMNLNSLNPSTSPLLTENFLFCLNTTTPSLKKLNTINIFFNSFLLDFLNFYNFF